MHYTVWLANGETLDSSRHRKAPARFRLTKVIKGWAEGVELMVVGEQRRLWIPGTLAYGDKPRRAGLPYGALVFDVELIGIE